MRVAEESAAERKASQALKDEAIAKLAAASGMTVAALRASGGSRSRETPKKAPVALTDGVLRLVSGYGMLKLGGWLKVCESPIEQSLLVALLTGHFELGFGLHEWPAWYEVNWKRGALCGPIDCLWVAAAFGNWLLVPQFEYEGFRLDFLIASDAGCVAIECDGHDFHERTKEQARRDKARDRKLQRLGWRVLRFAGSEIFTDPQHCAREVVDLLVSMSEERHAV